jgi:hypothetical protein
LASPGRFGSLKDWNEWLHWKTGAGVTNRRSLVVLKSGLGPSHLTSGPQMIAISEFDTTVGNRYGALLRGITKNLVCVTSSPASPLLSFSSLSSPYPSSHKEEGSRECD